MAATFTEPLAAFAAPSINAIAEGCNLPPADVREALRELALRGWLHASVPADDSSPVRGSLTLPEVAR